MALFAHFIGLKYMFSFPPGPPRPPLFLFSCFFLSPVTLAVYQSLTVNPAISPFTLLSHRPDSSSGTQAGLQATHSYPSIRTYLATTPSILPKMTNHNPISIQGKRMNAKFLFFSNVYLLNKIILAVFRRIC